MMKLCLTSGNHFVPNRRTKECFSGGWCLCGSPVTGNRSFSLPAGLVLLASFLFFNVFCFLLHLPLCNRPNWPILAFAVACVFLCVCEPLIEICFVSALLRRALCDCKYGLLIWRTPAGLARRAVRLTSVCYFKPQWECGCRVTLEQCKHNDTGVDCHIWTKMWKSSQKECI